MTTAAAGESGFPAARALVYRDGHETSLPLLVLGAVVTVCVVAQIAWPDGNNIGAAWQLGVALTIAFAALWLTFRRRAAGHALKSAPGFGLAAVIGAAIVATPLALVLVYAGPFVIFGLGLAAAGLRLGNRFLAGWAMVIGAVGVFEGFFGITNRIPYSLWSPWEHPAIYLALGVLTLLAGVIVRVREDRAAPGVPGQPPDAAS
jgi:hypothetical protein